jgi:hypothetical protein
LLAWAVISIMTTQGEMVWVMPATTPAAPAMAYTPASEAPGNRVLTKMMDTKE